MRAEELDGIRILMVDEDRYLAEILSSILESFGVASVRHTTAYDDAIEYLDSLPIECVFTDWLDSDEDGLAIVHHIRGLEDPLLRALPIVLCTARTELEDICAARDAGVTEIIAKPFSPRHVLQKLNSALFQTRNFVSAKGYAGPDRRRKSGQYDGPERRGDYGLAQDQIDDVMDSGPTDSSGDSSGESSGDPQ